MKLHITDEVKQDVKNWWTFLITGILFTITALLLMFYPLNGFATLSLVFSVCMFTGGIFEIIFSFGNKDNISGWGWYFMSGIIDLIMGFYLMSYPEMSMAVLPFIVAFWFMFRGFSMIGFAMDLHSYGSRDWGWVLTSGILITLFSITIILFPTTGVFSVVYIAAFSFLSMGLTRIMISFALKKLKYQN